ncbi:MAG: hypothetical protein L0219_05775, partial [Phycisphaerales bacterium]|nr:hypothetical protein [Phycisphaerales bacterium]
CMFYPFLPGKYDAMSVSLSMIAQGMGLTGLLLVPIGVLWLIYELAKRSARAGGDSRKHKGNFFALAAIGASFVVAVAAAMGAVDKMGWSIAVVVLAAWAYWAWRCWRRLRVFRNSGVGAFNPAPLYLIFIPSVLVLAQFTLIKHAVEFSRKRAIMGSAEFINAIEAYRNVHGRYPFSLASEHYDYEPPIIGIERYHYEPSGNAYNVFFEQFITFPLGTREFVMYNPLDEQVLASHDSDRLLWTPEQQAARPGYYAVHDASSPHWKYFWFD